jgi:hypothetical protein
MKGYLTLGATSLHTSTRNTKNRGRLRRWLEKDEEKGEMK